MDEEEARSPTVLLLDERGPDGALLVFHVGVASDALVAEGRRSARVQGARLDRCTHLHRVHFEPGGNASVGVGSAVRGDVREKSWERSEQAAGRW
jgi:hypothetical protein